MNQPAAAAPALVMQWECLFSRDCGCGDCYPDAKRRAAARARALFAALLANGDAYELAGDTLEAAAKDTGFEIVAAPEAPGDVFVLRYHDGARFLVGADTSHDGPPIFVGVDIPAGSAEAPL
jgi:hypothetical protein